MRQKMTRALTCLVVSSLCILVAGPAVASDDKDKDSKKTMTRAEYAAQKSGKKYRPLVAFHEVPESTNTTALTISGVVFSRTPIARVQVGDRVAKLRQAVTADLVSFKTPPKGAAEAPHRTFFELPDASLEKAGANDIVVQAVAADGRRSDIHRITVLRSKNAESPDQQQTEETADSES